MKTQTTAFALSATLLLAGAAYAQVKLDSVRIGAKDSVADSKFYEAAFGMHEVNRIDTPAGPEIFVNFGATADTAKANKSEPIVIMHRDSDDAKDPIAHIIFNVKDMSATVAAVKAAGVNHGWRSAPVRQDRPCDRHRDRSRRQSPGTDSAPVTARSQRRLDPPNPNSLDSLVYNKSA